MKYPKVLIVGQYFNTTGGGGITLTNLFTGWDKQSIACAAENIYDPNFEVCDKYYQLGLMENERRFPFNLNPWKKYVKSGVVHKIESSTYSSPNVVKTSWLRRQYLNILLFTGIFHYKRRHKVSEELLSWIQEFSPDIIYSQLSSIELIELVNDIHKSLRLPIAIHIMDDWPLTVGKGGLFKSYWFRKIDNGFRQLLSNAKVLMSISEAMSMEYLIRYGYKFVPFHNPIDLKFWNSFSKENYEFNGTFIILYAGRIGLGIERSIDEIAEAVGCLNLKGYDIRLHIQATNFNPLLDELKKFDYIKINPTVSYSQLPAIFSQADLLLLPNDFDNKSLSFLKYSMPTKASEYMVSGTPILLYSSVEAAITAHALKYDWAYVVSEQGKSALEAAISELYKRQDLRIKLGNTAKEYARNNFDGVIIRERFRQAFMQ